MSIFIKDKDEILKFKEEYDLFYNAIKNMHLDEYQPSMDKNTTCIIYYCVSNHEYEEFHSSESINSLQKLVCDIEEDLYYFKKNVLVYSEAQHVYAKNVIDFERVCSALIGNGEGFNDFKLNNIKEFKYDLIMNLFIKLPFLNFSKYFKTSGQPFKTVGEYIKETLEEKEFGKAKEKQILEIVKLMVDIEDDEKFTEWLDHFDEVIE